MKHLCSHSPHSFLSIGTPGVGPCDIVDGIDGEKFQAHTLLLAICKVDKSLLDVQWNGWVV